MKCPSCNSENAYVGLNVVECVLTTCPNYSEAHFTRLLTQAVATPNLEQEHAEFDLPGLYGYGVGLFKLGTRYGMPIYGLKSLTSPGVENSLARRGAYPRPQVLIPDVRTEPEVEPKEWWEEEDETWEEDE